ncbi:unannotated protein [freshwater metagenome]|uniref:Unannotated protein n=1 Tax=freshwater metagenome TaxID=449393 RepID=A0A6J5YB47_9ZZZZ
MFTAVAAALGAVQSLSPIALEARASNVYARPNSSPVISQNTHEPLASGSEQFSDGSSTARTATEVTGEPVTERRIRIDAVGVRTPPVTRSIEGTSGAADGVTATEGMLGTPAPTRFEATTCTDCATSLSTPVIVQRSAAGGTTEHRLEGSLSTLAT